MHNHSIHCRKLEPRQHRHDVAPALWLHVIASEPVLEALQARTRGLTQQAVSCVGTACAALLMLSCRCIVWSVRATCSVQTAVAGKLTTGSRPQSGRPRAWYTRHASSYKRGKGKGHSAEKRLNMHPHKPHATSQPSRLSHTRHASACRCAMSTLMCLCVHFAS